MRCERLTIAIERGIRFLAASQRSAGDFPTYWSRHITMDRPTEVGSPFITGMILLALLPIPETAGIQERGLDYLEAVRRADGTFAFFDSGIDPDLDDTCLLNWLLYRRDAEEFPHRALGARVAAMQKPNGRFPTWIGRSSAQSNPIDPCVNVNVLRYLHACGMPSTSLVSALQLDFRRRPFRGTFYYRPDFSFAYLASTLVEPLRRAVVGEPQPGQRAPNRSSYDPLETPMQLVFVAGSEPLPALGRRLANQLVLFQGKSGAWPAWAMFRAFNYWGSAELTTAITLQALSAYRRVFECEA